MEANETPEKIYLDDSMSTDTAGELWSDALWFDTKVSDDSIEYIRTDAFIEKARKWFNSKNGIVITDTKALFEEFVDYMEGE